MPATLIVTAQPALAAPGTYYCDSYSANPIKVNDNGSGGYAVEQLTGIDSSPSSSSIHTLGISEINALGISPVDDKAYGIVAGKLLVRFDNDEVRYVADVEESATQGTFDVHGDYIYGDASGVYRVRRPDLLTGYTSSSDSGISDQSSPTTLVSASTGQVADWAAIRADLGSGVANYLVGLDGQAGKVVVVKYQTHGGASDTATGSSVTKLTPSTAFPNSKAWRSAWYWQGRLIFQHKNGDVYEVGTNAASDLSGTADVTDLGNDDNIKDGDGMNCFDAPGFTVVESSGSTTVTESGGTDTFTVVLDSKPAGNVVITVSSSDSGEATVGAPLTFTSGNWDSAQTVTVTGVDDDDDDGNIDSTINLVINDGSTNDVAYDGVASQTVTATTVDDDPQAGFTVTESSGSTAVTEGGGTDTFTVVLTTQPDSNVVISVVSADTGEATVSASTLTFTTGNWDSAQTITVTGVDDDIIDGSINTTITLAVVDGSSDNNFDPLANQTVTAATADNDSAGFTVTESSGSTAVTEGGGTDTFTVVLTTQPDSNVVISVVSADTGEATVSASTLTFTTGNWDSAQTITVTGVDDDIIDGSINTTITLAVVDGSSDNNFDPLANQTVTAATADNDSAGFTVTESSGSTAVTEGGGTDTFTVVLTTQPDSNVVISVVSADTGEATVSASTLTFTTGNWDSAQTITVTGVDDDIIDGSINTTITLAVVDGSSDNNFDPLANQTVTAATADNDSAGFTVTESSGSTAVTEGGGTDTFTVVLTTQPDSNVVISVVSADTGEATVSASTLTFTTGNWDSAQTITVTGVDDDIIDGSINTTITLAVVDGSSDNNFDPLANQTVTAATADNDSAGFTVTQSDGTTQVSESGSTDTFTVVLTAEPDSNVVISVVSADTGEATVSASTLTFTTGNWDSAQTITVTGVDDDIIDGSINTTITLAVVDGSSDNNFDPLANQTVTAATADNDSAGFTVTQSDGTTQVSESGSTDTFTVVLTAEPDSNVVISVVSADTGEATVSASTLTFTTGNWDSAQTITVTGVDDDIIDGSINTTITLAVVDGSSDNNFDPLANQTVTAATADNDSAGFTVTQSDGTTQVSESGSTDTFTVVLTAEPDSNVVISVVSADTGEATVSASTLTFTTGNWDSAQTITVTGVDDDIIDGSINTTITLAVVDGSSDNNFDPLANQTVTAATADNDSAGFTVTQSDGTTQVSESGSTDTFTVVLTAEPDSNVVISVVSADTGEATVSAASLTFTTGNWDSAQTITVTGVDDGIIDGSINTTITLAVVDGSSDNNFDPLANQTVTAATADNDSAGFTKSKSTVSVSETGTTDTFTVVLNIEPASDVVISVVSADTGEATVSASTLTFTSGNWNSAQTITVTGVDDDTVDGSQDTTITLAVVDGSSDDNFDSLSDQTITATTADPWGFTVTESSGSTAVTEGGGTDTFTVVLTAEPASNVVISVVSADTGEATVSAASLTFTTGNWDSAQTITVTGVDDGIIDGSINTTITLAVVDGSSDNNFDPLANQTVTAATADNDSAGFTKSKSTVSVSETGTTDTFTVVLNIEPASDVVISVVSADTGEATVSASTLTFTSGNWNSAQTITVTGVDDDTVDGSQDTTITLAVVDGSSDDNFDSLSDQTITATTADPWGFTVTESSGSTAVTEGGGTDTFTVVLTAEPASNVVISVVSADTGEATVSAASLTFTTGNWDSAQTITVTGVDDGIIDGSINTTITLAVVDGSSDNNFDPLANQTVTAATADNDSAGFTKSKSTVSVSETGTTDTFTVVLNIEPASDVVISVVSADTGEATVSASTLTFTSGNWNSAQTITVTGVDDDTVDGSQDTTITLAVVDGSSDDNFDSLSDQTITATTADPWGFTVTESSGSTAVTEGGGTDTFTVVLTAEPASNVVISVVSADTGEATVSAASLTFTTGNWDSAQTITVTGVDDGIIDGSINTTITLAVVDGSSDNNFDPLANQTVTAATADNDSAGFTKSKSTVSVSETGTTDTFTVVLNIEPASDVVISVVSADTGEATVSASTLTFTSGNWDSAQTITVTGVDDDIIDGSINTTITLAVVDGSSDDNFDPLANQTVTVTTVDNDEPGGGGGGGGGGGAPPPPPVRLIVTQSNNSTYVSEDETTDTFTVALDTEPTGNVVVLVSGGDITELTLAPAALIFTSTDWNIPQTVTVTGVDDILFDGIRVTYITISVFDELSADEYGAAPSISILVDTYDNEVAGYTVVESGGSTVVSEDGDTDSFTVVLDERPGSNVAFSVTSQDEEEGLVSPFMLTFTPSSWDTPQTVVVTGVNDGLDDGDQDFLVVVSVVDNQSDSAFTALSDTPVSAVNLDNDDEPEEEEVEEEEVEDVLPACVVGFGSLVESEGSTVMSESGSSDSFTFALGSEPAGDVVVSVASSDLSEAVVLASALTFTASNWDTPQTVVVTGVNDGLSDGDQAVDVTLSAIGFEPVVVGVINADNDGGPQLVVSSSSNSNGDSCPEPPAEEPVDEPVEEEEVEDVLPACVVGFGSLVESEGSTVMSESGSSDSFTFALGSEPAGDVVVSVASSDLSEAVVLASALTFTASNWDTPQTVVVTGVNDGLSDGDQAVDVTLSAIGFEPVVVGVINADNDGGPQLVVSSSSNSNGDSCPEPPAEEPVDEPVEEEEVEDVLPACVVGFGSLVESEGSTVMSESGSSDSFTFALGSEPAGDVVVSVASSDLSEAVVLASALTFTASNWDTPQTVVVTGVNDGLSDGDQAVDVTLSAIGFEPVVVGVINADNDGGPQLVVSSSSNSNGDSCPEPPAEEPVDEPVEEEEVEDVLPACVVGFGSLVESEGSTVMSESGSSDSFTFALGSEPAGDVVVSVASSDLSEAVVLASALTFTASNWDTPQTVVVTGVNDGLSDGDQAVDVTLSAIGFEPVVVGVINADNDGGPQLVVSSSSNSNGDSCPEPPAEEPVDDEADLSTEAIEGFGFIVESEGSTVMSESGSSDSFTFALGSEPAGDVVVSVASSDLSEAVVLASALTFTASNWDTPQTVVVTGVNDGLSDGDQAVDVTLSAVGFEPVVVGVINADND